MRFWSRQTRPVGDDGVAAATLVGVLHSLRCERCDVTWRGSSSVPCWCCGAPGAISGEVRIFAD